MKVSELKIKLTKDEITRSAVRELIANGCRVRKVHNVGAYRNRRHQVEPGWSDVQGYDKQGKAILCEIKTQGDRFSPEQIDRLDDLHQCGGIALVAYQVGTTVAVIEWDKAKIIFKI